MQAIRCDRCGRFYLKGNNIVSINDISYTLNMVQLYDLKQRSMDFCEDCKSSFADWFNKTEKDCDVTKD